MTEDDLNERLAKAWRAAADRRPRMLTPGGSGVWPDKKLMEESVVRDLVAGLHERGERSLSDVRPRPETKPQTPPDVLATNETGGLVGIEVVELVDQEVIEMNLPISKARFQAMDAAKTPEERGRASNAHREKVRDWTGSEVLDEVARLIAEKDAKLFAEDGVPYAERWLVIHTAEPLVRWSEVSHELTRRTFAATQFDRVYLVDRNPVARVYPWSTRGYPWWRILPR